MCTHLRRHIEQAIAVTLHRTATATLERSNVDAATAFLCMCIVYVFVFMIFFSPFAMLCSIFYHAFHTIEEANGIGNRHDSPRNHINIHIFMHLAAMRTCTQLHTHRHGHRYRFSISVNFVESSVKTVETVYADSKNVCVPKKIHFTLFYTVLYICPNKRQNFDVFFEMPPIRLKQSYT